MTRSHAPIILDSLLEVNCLATKKGWVNVWVAWCRVGLPPGKKNGSAVKPRWCGYRKKNERVFYDSGDLELYWYRSKSIKMAQCKCWTVSKSGLLYSPCYSFFFGECAEVHLQFVSVCMWACVRACVRASVCPCLCVRACVRVWECLPECMYQFVEHFLNYLFTCFFAVRFVVLIQHTQYSRLLNLTLIVLSVLSFVLN